MKKFFMILSVLVLLTACGSKQSVEKEIEKFSEATLPKVQAKISEEHGEYIEEANVLTRRLESIEETYEEQLVELSNNELPFNMNVDVLGEYMDRIETYKGDANLDALEKELDVVYSNLAYRDLEKRLQIVSNKESLRKDDVEAFDHYKEYFDLNEDFDNLIKSLKDLNVNIED